MAGAPAGLPAGVRLSDHVSLGVIARAVPAERVGQVLAETGKASERERDLPAQVMVYYPLIGQLARRKWPIPAARTKAMGRSASSAAAKRLLRPELVFGINKPERVGWPISGQPEGARTMARRTLADIMASKPQVDV